MTRETRRTVCFVVIILVLAAVFTFFAVATSGFTVADGSAWFNYWGKGAPTEKIEDEKPEDKNPDEKDKDSDEKDGDEKDPAGEGEDKTPNGDGDEEGDGDGEDTEDVGPKQVNPIVLLKKDQESDVYTVSYADGLDAFDYFTVSFFLNGYKSENKIFVIPNVLKSDESYSVDITYSGQFASPGDSTTVVYRFTVDKIEEGGFSITATFVSSSSYINYKVMCSYRILDSVNLEAEAMFFIVGCSSEEPLTPDML